MLRKFALLFIALVFIPTSHAADEVTVTDAWVRLPPPGAKIAAAYLTLNTKQTINLSHASSPAAEAVEIHTMSMKNGVMEMRQLNGLALKPGTPVKLEPGGLHIMLIDLKKPLKEGDTVQLTLNFKKGKRAVAQNIQATVKSPK